MAGCGDEKPVAEKEGPKETVKQPEEKGTVEPAKPTEPEKGIETPKRDLAGEWKTLAADAKGKLEAGQFDESQKSLEKLDKLYAGDEKKSAEQADEYQVLSGKLAEARNRAGEERESR